MYKMIRITEIISILTFTILLIANNSDFLEIKYESKTYKPKKINEIFLLLITKNTNKLIQQTLRKADFRI